MAELLGVYAVKNKEDSIRIASRSGGVFTALSDCVLKENGSIYGCILSDDFSAYHVKATNEEERNRMRGSKYIQSDMGNSFRNVLQDLSIGKKVLFSGTSCQIDGLRKYLGKDYTNLFCVDIVCHGVPSPKVWKDYIKWQEHNCKKKIRLVDFRNKRDFGWTAHVESLYTVDGKCINSSIFTKLFYEHNILRPSCYECKYKSIFHPSDITLADYWGIENVVPGFSDDKGVSLVLINTIKGKLLFDDAIASLNCVPTDISQSLQPPLQHPYPRPSERDAFWNDYYSRGFDYIAKKYGGYESKPVAILKRIMRILKHG